jgi:L-iditol 2-dehydrogenase
MTAPGRMVLERFPVPRIHDTTALVRMLASGICGTDKHMYLGGSNLSLPGAVVNFPVIPGHENVGVVEKIGRRASEEMRIEGPRLEVGERVVVSADIICGRCYFCRNTPGYPWCENHLSYGDVISCSKPPYLFGGWAEKMYVVKGTFLFRVPKSITDFEAVLVEPLAVAYGAFSRAVQSPNTREGFSPADTVVVQGVGPLGLCNVMMAKMLGAGQVIAIDTSKYRLKIAKSFGVKETILIRDYPSDKDRNARVMELTDERGVDMAIECTGDPNSFSEGLNMLRLGGTYLVEGSFVEVGASSISVARQVVAKNARIFGVAGMPYQAYARVLELIARHKETLPLADAVTHKFGIKNSSTALDRSMRPESMKVVVTP